MWIMNMRHVSEPLFPHVIDVITNNPLQGMMHFNGRTSGRIWRSGRRVVKADQQFNPRQWQYELLRSMISNSRIVPGLLGYIIRSRGDRMDSAAIESDETLVSSVCLFSVVRESACTVPYVVRTCVCMYGVHWTLDSVTLSKPQPTHQADWWRSSGL